MEQDSSFEHSEPDKKDEENKRLAFGNRHLTNEENVFKFNAWLESE
jgi:hypothetical protein